MLFLNTITGKTIVASSLHHIPGNIVNRGLSHQFIELNQLALEYSRLVTQLQTFRTKNICVDTTNTIKAINDFNGFL